MVFNQRLFFVFLFFCQVSTKVGDGGMGVETDASVGKRMENIRIGSMEDRYLHIDIKILVR